ncbi:MAG: hypothetical protein ACOVS5_08815, partial [Oligoflexus sp.]
EIVIGLDYFEGTFQYQLCEKSKRLDFFPQALLQACAAQNLGVRVKATIEADSSTRRWLLQRA